MRKIRLFGWMLFTAVIVAFLTGCSTLITETKETYDKVYKPTHLLPPNYVVSEKLPYTANIRVNKENTLYDRDDRNDEYRFQAGLRLDEAVKAYLSPMFTGEKYKDIIIDIDTYNLEISHKRKEGTIKYLTCHDINIKADIFIDIIIASWIDSNGSYCGDETGIRPKEDSLFLAIVNGIENLRPRLYEAIIFPEKEKGRFESLMRENPNDWRVVLALANLSRLSKDYNLAISAARNAIKLQNSFEAYFVLGLTYEEMKQYHEAINNFKKTIELRPQILSAYQHLSEIYLLQENYIQNVNLWGKAITVFSNNWHPYFQLAIAYAHTGKYKDAITNANKAIELSTITGIGISIAIENDFPVVKKIVESGPAKKAGIEVGDKIVKINGQSIKGWDINKIVQNIRGAEGAQITLTIEKKDEEVEKTITSERMIQKEAASSLGLRSLVYGIRGNIEQSFRDAQEAYALDLDNEWARRAISVAYIQKGKGFEEALKILSTSKESFDRLLEALLYSKKGDLKRSVEIYMAIPEDYLSSESIFRRDFRKMVFKSLLPYLESKKGLARSLENKSQYKEALKEYAELIRFTDKEEAKEIRSHIAMLLKTQPYLLELPEEARKYAVRAEEYTKEVKFDEAIQEYKRALRIAPFFPDLYRNIALNYGGLKAYRQAIEYMNIYLELYPDAPDARVARDEIYRWEVMTEKEEK
ncbi:tetratricopeptide repeat protein [Thermodesulfovibrio thiophilus]|uniref:tetratricopeptide repeat protein n=1 Tax=Thermodesulfovibrio thiophilus TaxID=340095 RepID=UPI001815DD76|nr:tetratricopeptide repeat protein [Thermodesulfovibrio thiophilus]HHW20393.1 tetratricopeptide repeat protein [Thermodesulfovibrio thiophilus]